MLREGSLRQDLAATLKPLMEREVNLQRLIFVTDSMSPNDVAERGHMDHVVRRAISLGMSPVQAIQAITLNAATYSGLGQEIGGIAPGRFADLVLLEDLHDCRVQKTLIGGKVVAEEGRSLIPNCPVAPPEEMFHSLKLTPSLTPNQLQVPSAKGVAKIRVMELLNQTITAEKIVSVDAPSGYIAASLETDLLKVAMFDRHGQSGRIVFGFLQGLGAKLGAVGTTVNLDENTLMVIGSNDADMAHCANALIEWGGGIAVVDGGEFLAKIELPLGGLCSLAPWRVVGGQLGGIQSCLRERGSPFSGPLCPIIFLSFVTLPSLRITSRGLINAKERRIVPLFLD
jgi:adenine deaminase